MGNSHEVHAVRVVSLRPVSDNPRNGGGRLGSLIGGWRVPAQRDGLALVLSSGLTAGVGVAYWAVAARTADLETVGRNATLLSAMMLIGGGAHLNMTHALLRFVPVAGTAARRLVLGGYLVAAVLSSLVGGVFALGASIWAPEAVETLGAGRLVVFFMLACPVWALFTVQDYVLTAVSRAWFVPVENTVFAVLKVALLLAAVSVTTDVGIALSWVVATALIVLAVNAWLVVRVLPAHGRERAADAEPITIGAVGRFVRGDYAGAVFWQAAMTGMTVFVGARLGGEQAAVWNIVWQIGLSLFLVASGMGQSMIAHGAADPGRVDSARRAMVTRSLTLIVPAVCVLVVTAPWVLQVFGQQYRDAGAATLGLVALAAVPNVVVSAAMSAARVRRRPGLQFAIPASVAGIVIVTAWVLMPSLGILGVGVAWLFGLGIIASVIVIGWAPWLPPLLSKRIDAARGAVLLRRVGRTAITRCEPQDCGGWAVQEVLAGGSESVVAGIGPPDGVGVLLKASDTDGSRQSLRHQSAVLRELRTDPRVGCWSAFAPMVLDEGEVGGSYYLTESRLPGEVGLAALREPTHRRWFLSSALTTIGELHCRTGSVVVVSEAEITRFVDEPLDVVRGVVPRAFHGDARELGELLGSALRGRRVSMGWAHGDYNPANVLTDPDGRVSGVIDWCDATREGLQILDLVVFHQLAYAMDEGAELGPQLLRWLSADPPELHDLLRRSQRMLGGDPVDTRVLLLLGWLQHVSTTCRTSGRCAANPVWNRRNLRLVLRAAVPLLRSAVSQPARDAAIIAYEQAASPRLDADGSNHTQCDYVTFSKPSQDEVRADPNIGFFRACFPIDATPRTWSDQRPTEVRSPSTGGASSSK